MKKLKIPKKLKMPRQYSLVKFNIGKNQDHWKYYPFIEDRHYIFLGDIPNMPGHCVVVDSITSVIYSRYHTDSFIEVSEEEL